MSSANKGFTGNDSSGDRGNVSVCLNTASLPILLSANCLDSVVPNLVATPFINLNRKVVSGAGPLKYLEPNVNSPD